MTTSRSEPAPRRAAVIGTGLIGGSIGLALRRRGWHVTGRDLDPGRAQAALGLGALDAVGDDPRAEVVFVATPASAVAAAALGVLGPDQAGGPVPSGRPVVVSDVAGVKAPVVAAVDHPQFVGGHPMAGSEQEGVEGADPELFVGATWVLTPTATTDPSSFTCLRSVISGLGADVIAIPPQRHDALVALVSHVPHLAAATLMGLAATGGEDRALLRLAAGGFRDMTRVAAGHPGIWPDICADNRHAIVAGLDRLSGALADVRALVDTGDRQGLLDLLEAARVARRSLPGPGAARAEDLAELRLPVPDRPGVLAEVTTLAGELGVNIDDLEIAHSAEGQRGVLILVVDARSVDTVRHALVAAGLRPSPVRRLA